jgi:hypothetical protein
MPEIEPGADSIERHQHFVQRVLASGVVWGLKGADGWVMSCSTDDDTEDREIIPFWSDRAYASQCAKDDWADYLPTEIPLNEFLDGWLPGMDTDGLLVGTNWTAHLVGHEVEPLELLDEIVAASPDDQ